MEQESTLDFKALRAKFQGEEFTQKQPTLKPALPDKPKVVPPPQSPTSYIPVGARPSLLTSINQSLEGKTVGAPRVVFKDDQKDMKKPLIPANPKGKDRSEGKVKGAKEKPARESHDKLEDEPQDQKQKKENGKEKKFFTGSKKESSADLVPASPPPKGNTQKKKSIFGLKKTSKRDSTEVPVDPILDMSSADVPGPAPLIPVPSEFGNPTPENTESVLPNTPTLSDSSAGVEISPPSVIPESPDFIPPPAFIPDIPAPEIPNIEFEIPHQEEDPASTGPISSSSSFNISSLPPLVPDTSPPPAESSVAAETGIEAVSIAAVDTPPAPVTELPQSHPSPKLEHPMSALSALGRAEDMSQDKKVKTVDQRILGALQKAKRKTSSPVTTPTRPYSITPPPEETPPSVTPPHAWLSLPPIDYVGSGSPRPAQAAQVNGIHHPLEGISEEKPDPPPELLVLPPAPARSLLPPAEPLITPEKPARSPANIIPPPLVQDNGITLPSGFPDAPKVPPFDNVASGAQTPDLPDSQWSGPLQDHTNQNAVDVGNLPQFHTNGISAPTVDVNPEAAFEDDYQKIVTDGAPVAGLQDENGTYENLENTYEDIGASGNKKKTKTDNTKKRKGPPKNPYAESGQETNQEKSKTGRFGKTEKKAAEKAVEGSEEKESKKKEKQRLEKEKKEQKEKQEREKKEQKEREKKEQKEKHEREKKEQKEREKKEQKEREKKESEMKKKFKITGQEDAIYQAKVTVTAKGRKNDLPVKSGDTVSVIRTTNCPKGKWLARDSSNNYGYVAVDHVELDIQEMLELGKKARKTSSNVTEPDSTHTANTLSNHYPLSGESFEDDSEEWTGDEEETGSPTAHPSALISHSRTFSAPEMAANKDISINHQHSHSDIHTDGSQMQAKHEALQKLATFFHSPKGAEAALRSPEPDTSLVHAAGEAAQAPKASSTTQAIDFDDPNTIILPPPDLYA